MNSGNNKATLKLIAERLSAEDDVLLALAFGSLIAGTARADSDRPGYRRCYPTTTRLPAADAVDLVDMGTAGVTLMRSILGRGKRLVCKDRCAYDNLVSRMLGGVADFLPYRQRLLRERRKAWIR
jgi:hypothetical protein